MKQIKNAVKNKEGSMFVEAAIVIPLIILVTIFLIRVFTFYLQILNTTVKTHEQAINEWKSWSRYGIKSYEISETVSMAENTLFDKILRKKIACRTYLFDADKLIRAGEIIEKK